MTQFILLHTQMIQIRKLFYHFLAPKSETFVFVSIEVLLIYPAPYKINTSNFNVFIL